MPTAVTTSADVMSARVSMPVTMYRTPEQRFAVMAQIVDRLAALPGVSEAAFTSESPLTAGGSTSAFNLKSPTADGGIVAVQASPRIVSPRYFSALRIAVIAGRTFSELDTRYLRAGRSRQPGVRPPIPRRLAPGQTTTGWSLCPSGRRAGRVDGHRRRGRRALRKTGDQFATGAVLLVPAMNGRLPVQTVTLLTAPVGRSGSGGGRCYER